MLYLTIPQQEYWDPIKEEFIIIKEQRLQLEHSLISISKWESKWNKPFLSKTEKSVEETIDYIRCMTITQSVDPNAYLALTQRDIDKIQKYIAAPMTATYFNNIPSGKDGVLGEEEVTSELIYYWMVALTIPFECERWHINRLLTLIKICNIKNQPNKKMSQKDIMLRNKALNAQRRQKYKTKG